jgi:acyl-CoA synthetase (NDP forming)
MTDLGVDVDTCPGPAIGRQQASGGELAPLFAPRGVVVVGASSEANKLGGVMATSLSGGKVPVALVNQRGGDGMHRTVRDAAAASPVPLDLAVLCIPAGACATALEECADVGVGAALVCAGGFAEAGGAGVDHERRLLDVATATGVRLLGPNTSGFFVPTRELLASFVPGVAQLKAGPVAIVAASGGLNHALAFAHQRQDAGISLGVGIGAGIDVTAADVLTYLCEDEATRAIALHIESVTDGPVLLAAVDAVSQVKPVVAMVVGQHDIGEFAQSHTGALATSWRTTRALLRQAGAVVVDDEDALVTAATVLAATRLDPKADPGAALVTAQAGPGLLVADALHGSAVPVPVLSARTQEHLQELLPPLTFQSNPVDTGRPGPQHGEVISTVAADPAIDVVAVYGLTEPVVDLPREVAAAELGTSVAVVGLDGPADDVAAGRRLAAELGVPLVVGARALSTAVAALVQDARGRAARHEPSSNGVPVTSVHLSGDALSEAQAKDVLDALGIVTPERGVCTTLDTAQLTLERIGGPVAVKLSDASVLHKSEQGGVHLGVNDAATLEAAVRALQEIGASEFLVEAMAPAGVDLVVGARRDPVFGPVVLLGIGGIATEVYADVAIASVPTSPGRLAALPDQLAASELLDGFRGGPRLDRQELGNILRALGELLVAHPHLAEVEINPLRAHRGGLLALDAVLVSETLAHEGSRDHGDEEPVNPSQEAT